MDDWGYLGEDWQNPAVELDLNPLGVGEGVAISTGNKMSSKVGNAIKRPLTQGEKRDLMMLKKEQAATAVRQLLTRPATVIPKAIAIMSPAKAAAAMAKPMLQKQMMLAKNQATNEIKAQKQASVAEIKNARAVIANAVKAGTMTPAAAQALMKQKTAEIQSKNQQGMEAIKARAKSNVANGKAIQAKVHTALVKKQGIAVDQNRQKIEAEIRKVSASQMPAGAKAQILATLQKRLKGLDLAKAEIVKRKEVATVNQMVAKGVLPPAEARKLANTISKKADALKGQRMKMAKGAETAGKLKGRLYTLGKWIQAYESAIQFAQQAGSTSVVIPVGDMALIAPQAKPKVITTPSKTVTTPSKVVRTKVKPKHGMKGLGDSLFNSYPSIGYITEVSTQPSAQISKEVRMPVQTARVKLEKFKQEYAAIERKLQKNVGKPGVALPIIKPVTQVGQPVTPELLKAQETFIRQGIASGKVNAIVGAKAIKQLQTVDKLMKASNKPTLIKKPRPQMVIQVFISPEAVNQIRTGERMVRTKPGKGKTRAMVPRDQIPSAIPHATAKTPGTMANTVKMQPARPPAVSPARQATPATSGDKLVGTTPPAKNTMMAPAASIQKPGAIARPGGKRGRAQGRTLGLPKGISLTEMLNQMVVPMPKLKR
jgi:hypothetical protein